MLILIGAAMHHGRGNGKDRGTVDRDGTVINKEFCSSLSQDVYFGIIVLVQRGIGFGRDVKAILQEGLIVTFYHFKRQFVVHNDFQTRHQDFIFVG